MPESSNKRLGMLLDLSACIGCNACVVACKQENDVPVTKFNTWIESWDAGTYPNVLRANLPKLCNHCADPLCENACPTGATYVTDEGVVLIDDEKCTGCKTCIEACPYASVRWYDEDTKLVRKCTYCYHRTSQGMLPMCTTVCPTHARMFGDLNDPESDIAKRLAQVEAEGVDPALTIDTSTRYVGVSEMTSLPVSSGICHGGNVVVLLEDVPQGAVS